jgi:hypothetical protein
MSRIYLTTFANLITAVLVSIFIEIVEEFVVMTDMIYEELYILGSAGDKAKVIYMLTEPRRSSRLTTRAACKLKPDKAMH